MQKAASSAEDEIFEHGSVGKQWGVTDALVDLRDYSKFAEWSSYDVLREALAAGTGVSIPASRMPPQVLADWILRRNWCRAWAGWTGEMVSKLATQNEDFPGHDELHDMLLAATNPLLHGPDPEPYSQLRAVLGSDMRLGAGIFGSHPKRPDLMPRVHEKDVARLIAGAPLDVVNARRLLVRMLIAKQGSLAVQVVLSDRKMPDLCSDGLVEVEGLFYRLSELMMPRTLPVHPVSSRDKRASPSRGADR